MQTLPISMRPPPKRRSRRGGAGDWLAGVPIAHRAALAAAVVGAVACALAGVWTAWRAPGNDFTALLEASRDWRAGHGWLSATPPLRTPFRVLAAAPFTFLPYHLATALWSLASLVALLWSARALADLVSRPREPSWPWLLWLPSVLVWRPIASCLVEGRDDLLVLAFALAGLRCIRRNPASARGGAWIASATALWLPAGIFLVQLGARRQRVALARALLFLPALVLLPALLFQGSSQGLADLAPWAQDNARGFGAGPSAFLSALLLAAFAAAVMRRPAGDRQAAWASECALAASTGFLIAALANEARLIWLLPALAALTGRVADAGIGPRQRFAACLVLVAMAAWISGVGR